DQCIAAGFAPDYDPVDRVATWAIRGEIAPNTRYNVRLFAPRDPQDANGIRAFDGAALEKELTFAFTTGCEKCGGALEDRTMGFCSRKSVCPLPEGACDEPMPVAVADSPFQFLAQNCAIAGNCHGAPSASSGPSGSALRLDDDGAGGGVAG